MRAAFSAAHRFLSSYLFIKCGADIDSGVIKL